MNKGKCDYLGSLISVSQILNVDFKKYTSIELQLRYKNPDKYGFFTTQKFSVDTIKNLVDNDYYRIFISNVDIAAWLPFGLGYISLGGVNTNNDIEFTLVAIYGIK